MILFCFGSTSLTTYPGNRVKPQTSFLFTFMRECSSEKPKHLMWRHYETREVTAQGRPGLWRRAPLMESRFVRKVPARSVGCPWGAPRANPTKFSNLVTNEGLGADRRFAVDFLLWSARCLMEGCSFGTSWDMANLGTLTRTDGDLLLPYQASLSSWNHRV